ncbi:MAG: hypothetical protein Q9190_005327 [Brigantiaea leucoxantha]
MSSSSSTSAYAKELLIATLAVHRATLLTNRIFLSPASTKHTLSKSDSSPVTVADFGAQALIISALRHAFPEDEIMGEEEAGSLREDAELAGAIFELVREARLEDAEEEEVLGGGVKNVEEMLGFIDKGGSEGGGKGRLWALDPVDGTKGFLRGGQYAVALGLIVDGDVKVGVLGCPNLGNEKERGGGNGKGVLFSAVKGEGARSRSLGSEGLGEERVIRMKEVEDITHASFCESVEAGHSSHGDQAAIAKELGITRESVRMDSQAKYGSIARGDGDSYLRLPVSKTYVEKIWDHAAGDLIVREAGGEVTDAEGKRLDFSKGRTLTGNKGVVAAPEAIHGKVLEAVKKVLSKKS